jgi:hypothetical protein
MKAPASGAHKDNILATQKGKWRGEKNKTQTG